MYLFILMTLPAPLSLTVFIANVVIPSDTVNSPLTDSPGLPFPFFTVLPLMATMYSTSPFRASPSNCFSGSENETVPSVAEPGKSTTTSSHFAGASGRVADCAMNAPTTPSRFEKCRTALALPVRTSTVYNADAPLVDTPNQYGIPV